MFARNALRTALRQTSRRSYATGSHSGPQPKSSDLPWIVASAAVTIPLIYTLTSPPEAVKHTLHHVTSPSKEDHPAPASRKAPESASDEERAQHESSHRQAAESDKEEATTPVEADAPEKSEVVKKAEEKLEKEDIPKPSDLKANPESSVDDKERVKSEQPYRQDKIVNEIKESKIEETKQEMSEEKDEKKEE
ncbi:uncharacterized protein JCM6883_002542 [Sporobolomyces salmoneus]|uniref:uncharacterized protein n=1 Tax=Sporobolomyces salmoneus TaxID=183962 RepID=UPI00317AEA91